MPIHVDELHSEVAVGTGDLPLSGRQLEALVEVVAARVETRLRSAAGARDEAAVHRSALPEGGVPWR